jgi:hypothetical protein
MSGNRVGSWWLWLALAALCSPAAAKAQDVMASAGDWEYGADAELAAASTRNAQGWLFGLVCSPDCIGFVESDQPCEPGRSYQGLMKSTGREDPVPLECRPLNGRYALLFTPTAAFIRMLTSGPRVTVSVRLRGTADTEFRFSLNGAYDAIYVTLATAIAASGGGESARESPAG